MLAALGMGGQKITSLATPTVATDAATKGYVDTAPIADKSVTLQKLYHPTAPSRLLGSDSNAALTITGAANNGSGLVRLIVANTSTFATGQVKTVSDVVGTTEANGTWTITVVDLSHIDLQGSAFANVWISGGTIGGGVEEISLSGGLTLTGSVLKSSSTTPTVQRFISGSGTYTTPANCVWIRIRMVGGGSGGGGGNSSVSSTLGTASTFSGGTLSAGPGSAAADSGGGPGGSASGGNILNIPGGAGGTGSGVANTPGGMGGSSAFGGAGTCGVGGSSGTAAGANSGSGGGGGGGGATNGIGAGGGAGGYVEHTISAPAATYTYAVGTGGAGAAGVSAGSGGAGAAGIIIVEEYY